MEWRRILNALFALFIVLMLNSCEENPIDNNNSGNSRIKLSIVSGNNQTERTGAVLPESLVVMVSSLLNDPVMGKTVNFSTSNPGASVSPASAISGCDGKASCQFKLGDTEGNQFVMAKIETDSVIFTATAVEPSCDEEQIDKLCDWPEGHVVIATTSSSLLSGTGSVLIDFDPLNPDNIEKMYETTDTITDITFSARGELFLATKGRLFKYDHSTGLAEPFCEFQVSEERSITTNPGGIVAGTSRNGPFNILCPPECAQEFFSPSTFMYIRWENIAVHPKDRDIYILTGQGPPTFTLWRINWDGRGIPQDDDINLYSYITTGAGATPKGMCFDDNGNLYISFDSESSKNPFRRIVRVDADGVVDVDFFDFYEYGGNNQAAGRWGDIAYSDNKLFLIDKKNDRLVVIGTDGTWQNEYSSDTFSMPFVENDIYSITATPYQQCK